MSHTTLRSKPELVSSMFISLPGTITNYNIHCSVVVEKKIFELALTILLKVPEVSIKEAGLSLSPEVLSCYIQFTDSSKNFEEVAAKTVPEQLLQLVARYCRPPIPASFIKVIGKFLQNGYLKLADLSRGHLISSYTLSIIYQELLEDYFTRRLLEGFRYASLFLDGSWAVKIMNEYFVKRLEKHLQED